MVPPSHGHAEDTAEDGDSEKSAAHKGFTDERRGNRITFSSPHSLFDRQAHAFRLSRPDRARNRPDQSEVRNCLLYTSDAADEEDSVDLGGRRIIKKKK